MRKIAAWGLGILAAATLAAGYFRLFELRPVDSDQANAFFAAIDMWSGNWRLSGWVEPPESYWGLDLPLLAVIWGVTGKSLLTLRLVPALNWMILGSTVAALATHGFRPDQLPAALLLLAALILIPSHATGAANFYAAAPFHIMTVAGIIGAIALAAAVLRPGARSGVLSLVLVLLVIDESASDPMFIYVGAVPLLVALLLADSAPWAGRVKLLLILVAAIAAGRALAAINIGTGGYAPWQIAITLAPIAQIPKLAILIFGCVLSVLGCGPLSGGPGEILLELLRLPLLFLLVLPVCRVISELVVKFARPAPPRPPLDLVDIALCLVVLADIGAVLVSNLMVDIYGARYLLPAWAAGSALAVRRSRFSTPILAYGAIVALVAFGGDLHDALGSHGLRYGRSTPALIAALEIRGLRFGYGTYWLASDTTLASGGGLTVRAIHQGAGATLAAYDLVAKPAWFNGARSDSFFVMTDTGDQAVPAAAILAKFGRPASNFSVGNVIVDVYPGDLPSLR